ncbi:MAG TPA: phage protein Gp36 family protein [Bacteroidota bacterium]|nr:phage protein Gp36 family protein [Bacteroidota bacterium]
MALVTQEYLQNLLDRSTIEALFDALPNAVSPLDAADSLIKRYIGVIPDPPPDALKQIAADIVIWSLSGRQQSLSDAELQRREKRFDDALRLLEQLRDGTLSLEDMTTTPIAPEAGSSPLQGDMP